MYLKKVFLSYAMRCRSAILLCYADPKVDVNKKYSKCNSFQATSDLLNSEYLKVAIAQLYNKLQVCNFTTLLQCYGKLCEFNSKIIHNILICKDRLKKMGLTETDLCSHCGEVENSEHLLINCKVIKEIWEKN